MPNSRVPIAIRDSTRTFEKGENEHQDALVMMKKIGVRGKAHEFPAPFPGAAV